MPRSRMIMRFVAVLLALMLFASACGTRAADPAGLGQAAGNGSEGPDSSEAQDPAGEQPVATDEGNGAEPAEAADAGEDPDDRAPADEADAEDLLPEVNIEFIGGPVVAVNEADAGRKFVMLTYDDGPNPGTTELVLDALKEAGVKAVFFVTGYGAEHEDLLRRIHDEGHTIGTHTMNHLNLTTLTKEEQRAEIVPVNEAVERVTGQPVKYFRPPFGMYNEHTLELMDELGMQLVNWTHGSRDWEPDVTKEDPALVTAKVLAEVAAEPGDTALWPGAVVLLHDTLPWTAAASPDFIAGLKELGYEFVILR